MLWRVILSVGLWGQVSNEVPLHVILDLIQEVCRLNRNLIELSNHLGFYPNVSNHQKKYFNLDLGEFSDQKSPYSISNKNKEYLCALIKDKTTNIPYDNRKKLMVNLQQYYKLHHYDINNMKTQKVIESFRG